MRFHYLVWFTLALLVGGLGLSNAYAQKGMGEDVGIARAAVKPEIVTLQGKIVEVQTGPCKNTTGRAVVGTHVELKTSEGRILNVHLGPTAVVEPIAKRLANVEEVRVNAFRTDAMPEDHYVAQSFTVGKETIRLRDETLQPAWAGGQTRGRGGPRAGAGFGYGRGWGQGAARGVQAQIPTSDEPSDADFWWNPAPDTRRGYGYGGGAGRGAGRGAGYRFQGGNGRGWGGGGGGGRGRW